MEVVAEVVWLYGTCTQATCTVWWWSMVVVDVCAGGNLYVYIYIYMYMYIYIYIYIYIYMKLALCHGSLRW